MPTVKYVDALNEKYEKDLAEWESLEVDSEGNRAFLKPRPPVIHDDFKDVSITYPDEWLMGHIDLFWQGYREAPEDAAPSTHEIYGTIALCKNITGLKLDNIGKLPLHYRKFFDWLVQTVYIDSYLPATDPPLKN